MVLAALILGIHAARSGDGRSGFCILLLPAGFWLLSCCFPGAYALRVDGDGLTVRRPLSKTFLRWEAITGIEVEHRRIGRQGRLEWFIKISAPRKRLVGGALFVRDTYTLPQAELAAVMRTSWNGAKTRNADYGSARPSCCFPRGSLCDAAVQHGWIG